MASKLDRCPTIVFSLELCIRRSLVKIFKHAPAFSTWSNAWFRVRPTNVGISPEGVEDNHDETVDGRLGPTLAGTAAHIDRWRAIRRRRGRACWGGGAGGEGDVGAGAVEGKLCPGEEESPGEEEDSYGVEEQDRCEWPPRRCGWSAPHLPLSPPCSPFPGGSAELLLLPSSFPSSFIPGPKTEKVIFKSP